MSLHHVSEAQVRTLLRSLKLDQYERVFESEGVDGHVLDLTETVDELKELGMKALHAKKLLHKLKELRRSGDLPDSLKPEAVTATPSPPPAAAHPMLLANAAARSRVVAPPEPVAAAPPAKKFRGRVHAARDDFDRHTHGLAGNYHVFYPEDEEDIREAVAVAKSINHRVIIRSGVHTSSSEEEVADHAIVISLKHFNDIKVNGAQVIAETGASTRQIAKKLAAEAPGTILPLDENPLRSIVSNVLKGTSYLARSVGKLQDHLVEARVLRLSGTNASFETIGRDEFLAAVASGNPPGVVLSVTLRTSSVEGLWMTRWTLPYLGSRSFNTFASTVFGQQWAAHTDVALQIQHAKFDVVTITLTIAGKGEQTGVAVLQEEVNNLLAAEFPPTEGVDRGEIDFFTQPHSVRPEDILNEIAESGSLGAQAYDATLEPQLIFREVPTSQISSALDVLEKTLDHSIDNPSETCNPIRVSANLQLQPGAEGVVLDGFLFHHPESHSLFQLGPVKKKKPLLRSLAVASTPVLLTALERPLSKPIQGLQGPVFTKESSGHEFDKRIEQYATSSYPKALMTPAMICYPHTVQDVQLIVDYGRNKGLHVVARSGGHQYSGKSSGGSDTLVICFDEFKPGQADATLKKEGDKKYVHVKPGARLTSVAAWNAKKGNEVTIPHGECPRVALGGHFQTGGYGHLLRNYGLALDYVRSFEIVLADAKVVRVTRPNPRAPNADNDELYWGVCGGGPNSFGIVTDIELAPIQDEDHPHSFLWSVGYFYKKSAFLTVMKNVQELTKKVVAGTLPRSQDLFVTATSGSYIHAPRHPATILVEMVEGNIDGANDVNGDRIFRYFVDAVSKEAWQIPFSSTKESNCPLSKISNSFVRRPGALGIGGTNEDGREFPEPYHKRVNCTKKALSDEFVVAFTDLIDRAIESKKVKLVFQMIIGGGAFANPAERGLTEEITAIARRDTVFCFVYDLFYTDEQEALALQKEVEEMLIRTEFSEAPAREGFWGYTPEQESRVQWGSFGPLEETQMGRPEVQHMYYDSAEQYQRLQRLKQKVDPKDVFHTSFTVQKP